LSPDPVVQFPNNAQNFNRYSYVLNNPLSYMDPSGYFLSGLKKFFKKFWRPILAIVVSIVTAGMAAWAMGLGNGFWGSLGAVFNGGLASGWLGVAQGAAIGAAGGFAGGFVATGSLKGALVGAFTGALAGAVGGIFKFQGVTDFFGSFTEMARAAAHGISGGISSELSGGKFGQGFLSSFTSSLAYHSTPIGEMKYGVSRVMATAVVGGTASVIGGGKFENGAVTSAFQAIFNAEMSGKSRKEILKQYEDADVILVRATYDKDFNRAWDDNIDIYEAKVNEMIDELLEEGTITDKSQVLFKVAPNERNMLQILSFADYYNKPVFVFSHGKSGSITHYMWNTEGTTSVILARWNVLLKRDYGARRTLDFSNCRIIGCGSGAKTNPDKVLNGIVKPYLRNRK
ncbi:MAG: hypothetical protein AB3N14_10625, partial [Flavobacteriaceae bacterium]